MKRIFLFYSLFLFLSLSSAKAYDGITPGERWNDTNGTQINAHGGCVIYHEGAYYWFGEHRNVFYCNGISCYKSTDLYNWTYQGLALTVTGTMKPDGNDIAPGRVLERPKVVYNKTTGKWVMFMHWENGEHYGEAKVAIAQSDKIQGPYTHVRTVNPNGHDSRDQTLFVDTDGKAYHFGSTRMNSDMLITELTDDYLDFTENEYYALPGRSFEAPAIFKIDDTYWGIFSGCTGWEPNPGRSAYTFDLMDDWTTGVNFAIDNGKETTYRSQSTFVLKVPGYESAYVYMGDRWVSSNPGSSNVVWLPLSIRSGVPTVKWYDKWDLSIFKDVDRYKRAGEIIDGNAYLLLDINSNRLVSQNAKNGLHIAEDDETINLQFNIIETDKPYIYKIQETGSEKFFESLFGTLRLNPEKDAKSQEWLFLLQEDGSYKIKNTNDDKYFAINGNSTLPGSGIYLSDKSRARSFGLYFDTKHFDYEVADLFSATYHEDIAQQKKEQEEYLNGQTSINNIYSSTIDFEVYPSINNGDFSVKTSSSTTSSSLTIRIYEGVSGKLAHTQIKNTATSVVTVNLSGRLHSGMYLIKIDSGNDTVVKKIIVK